jgi:VCBS repeat protein
MMGRRVHKRFVVIVAVAVVCAAAGHLSRFDRRAAFVPYLTGSLPQNALGDFDGDGYADVARIDTAGVTSAISVQLSGSSQHVHLDAAVAVLIDNDIDHDGDLDLVATTSTGDVLIWLNDGHGQFTRQFPARTRSISGEASVDVGANEPALATTAIWAVPSLQRSAVMIGAARTRPPTLRVTVRSHDLLAAPLRAPPAHV